MKKSRLTWAGAITAVGILAVAGTGTWEGLRLYVYRDVVGVYTYCYGETKDAFSKRGQKFTKEQCDVLFIKRLGEFEQGMRSCLNEPDAIPDKAYVAFLDLAYNIGVHGFCRGSIPTKLNNHQYVAACNKLMAYVKAGGRTIKGLVNRRRDMRRLCLEGLREGDITLPWEEIPEAEVPPVEEQEEVPDDPDCEQGEDR